MAGARPLDATTLAALDDPFIKPVYFVSIAFDSGTVLLHDDLGTIVVGFSTYLGVGDLGSVEGLEERDDGSPNGITLRLSMLDSALLNEVLVQDYFRRVVSIYIGFRNIVTGAMISDIIPLFYGRIDDVEIVAGMNPSIAIKCETDLIAWDRPLNRYFSDTENQKQYPGKLGAKYMAAMASHKVTVGNKTLVNVSDTLNNSSTKKDKKKRGRKK